MHSSKLLQLFVLLTESERKRMKDFVRSPYFNSAQVAGELYDYLLLHEGGAPGASLSKQAVFSFLYPDQDFDDSKLRYCMSLLSSLIERFFTQQEFEQHPGEVRRMLQEQLFHRWAISLAEKAFKAWKKEEQGLPFRNAQHYYYQHLLSHEGTRLRSRSGTGFSQGEAKEVVENLDAFYLIRKLNLYCIFYSNARRSGKEVNYPLLGEILLHLQYHPYPEVPAISVYHRCLLMFREPLQQSHFQAFQELLAEHQHIFPESETRNLYYFALNYCAARIREGQSGFHKKAFELYQKMLEQGIIGKDHLLSPVYKNIFTLGIKTGAYSWVSSFLKAYKSRLEEADREDMFNLGKAQLCLARQEYDKVLPLLLPVDSQDVLLHAAVRKLRMQAYYELEETETLLSLIESTRKYLQRAALAETTRQSKQNFIRILKHLALARENQSPALKLRKEIDQEHLLEDKEWLLEKLYELE